MTVNEGLPSWCISKCHILPHSLPVRCPVERLAPGRLAKRAAPMHNNNRVAYANSSAACYTTNFLGHSLYAACVTLAQ
jgi:hypothetical protein